MVPQGRKITNSVFREIQKAKIEQVEVASNDLEGAYVAADVIDMSTGEVLIEANHELTSTAIAKIVDAGIQNFEVFFPDRDDAGNVISATLRKDGVKSQNDALLEIYRKLRPGDPPTLDTATQLFQGMFFDPRKYDFSRVGRMKFNIKLHERRTLRRSTSGRSTRRISSTPFFICCNCARGWARWTISIIWAIAVFARSANCSKTSSASAWCAWSARSKKRCRCTRKCRRRCRMTW